MLRFGCVIDVTPIMENFGADKMAKEQDFRKYIIECPICGSRDHSDGRCERDNDRINRYDEER